MAKEQGKRNGGFKITISVAITLAVLITGMGAGFQRQQSSIENVGEKVDEHCKASKELAAAAKEDGCDPSHKNEMDIAVMKGSMDRVEADVAELRIQQSADTAMILQAIRDNGGDP